MPAPNTEFVLTLSCADRRGIVAAVAAFLSDQGCTIRDSQQFGDEDTGRFFLRVHFISEVGPIDVERIRKLFEATSDEFAMNWAINDVSVRNRLLVMVSKQGHCLNDLLYRVRTGALAAEIPVVVSNHEDLRSLVEWHGIPFHHVPVTAETKPAAEDRLRALIEEYSIDTVVLARYMQILSDSLCRDLAGKAINIHHSLLPSFKGARPYFQAHTRGVKVVGATAHYVTADLDEGPIIEQDFTRVSHKHSAQNLTALGRDLEAVALARAVTAHVEHRVLLNGTKTVVFD
ncbi:formyltetrahydrofolate deformylase [Planosporangium flavigriseum]|nr:formyltetrahydrofolate deformylase [Planosporangium flavigriseum]